jgi:hypothetical protein
VSGLATVATYFRLPLPAIHLDNLPPPALVEAWQQAVFRTKSAVKDLASGP